jgi:Yip1 domain
VTDTVSVSQPAAGRKGLAARAVGVVISPRDTYRDIVASPRWFGVLALVVVVSAVALGVFLSTERGQTLSLDSQVEAMESWGVTVTDQMYEGMESRLASNAYFAVGGQVVFIPVFTLLIAGLAVAIFNVLLGGDATFRQVFAVVAHANVVGVLGLLFMLPLNYAREAMSNPTNLSVFLPMLDDAGFLARFLGAIDLFRIWWIVSLAIGLGVLYKRKTGPIAMSFFALYVVIALAIAGVMVALSGA